MGFFCRLFVCLLLFISVHKLFDEEQCSRELRHSYRSRCMVPQYPGEPKSREPVDDVFIPPSITPKSRKIHNPKSLISYNEIFTCGGSGEEERPTRVYLFGEVGSGKSTLISKMASDWTKQDKDSPLTTVPLLFVLDLTIMGNVGLHDAIVEQLLPEDTRFTSAQLKEFISENQSKVMIVLDGYDESIHEQLSQDVVDVLRNKGRPYLFSNSIAPCVAGGTIEVFNMLEESTELLD